MAGQANAAPVIIKRKKIIQGGGHHGGAWKVAYADFVTAMMAFFLLMWLLGATTEKQRKGVADYFSPTIPINRTSGGGSGAFGGDSVFSENAKAQNGTGATVTNPAIENKALGADGAGENGSTGDAQMRAELDDVQKKLFAFTGESMTMEKLMRHVVTKVTDEGVVIELFDLEDVPLFAENSAVPNAVTVEIAGLLAELLILVENQIAVNGHVRSYPMMMINNPVWDLSSERARVMRALIESQGLDPQRMQRVTGFADRKPVAADRMATRNNRLEIILLRRSR